MRKLLAACALFGGWQMAQAYELVAKASAWDETRWHFDIELADNDIGFTAFQLDITLEGDVRLNRDSITCGRLAKKHNVMLIKPEGHYCVVAYQQENKILDGKEGPLFSFTVVGDLESITIGNVRFVRPDGTSIPPAVCDEDGREGERQERMDPDIRDSQDFRIDRRGICISAPKRKGQ